MVETGRTLLLTSCTQELVIASGKLIGTHPPGSRRRGRILAGANSHSSNEPADIAG